VFVGFIGFFEASGNRIRGANIRSSALTCCHSLALACNRLVVLEERPYRLSDRWKEARGPDSIGQARSIHLCSQTTFCSRNGEYHTRSLEVGAHVVENVCRRRIQVGNGLRIEDKPPYRWICLGDQAANTSLEVVGIGEDERRIESIDEQPCDGLALGILTDVMKAIKATYTP
jgi:hypothetical protein